MNILIYKDMAFYANMHIQLCLNLIKKRKKRKEKEVKAFLYNEFLVFFFFFLGGGHNMHPTNVKLNSNINRKKNAFIRRRENGRR